MIYTVALAQVNPACGDLEVNVKMHVAQAEQALETGADLIVFPELSLTGYTLKDQ
ncbi:MAG: carbon-nitrogen hydrolase, partial [Caldiserica bacterium]|nr:carbon-nitrogen hydrolase [Caldisericota bacterium]